MPRDPEDVPEQTPPQAPDPAAEKESDASDFITRQVLDKDTHCFEG